MEVNRERGEFQLYYFTFVVFVFLLYFTNALDITERIMLSRSLDVPTFYTIYGLSFSKCITACDDHRKCSSVVFRRNKKACELTEHFPNQSIIIKDVGALVFAKGTWSNKDGTCGLEECTDRQTCDTRINTCISAECPSLENTVTSRFSGNRVSTGSVAIKWCNTGFVFPNGSKAVHIVCNSNGNWQTTDKSWEQVPDCKETTCQIMKSRNSTSMEYDSFDLGSQRVVKILCVFEDDFGYTYIPKYHVSHVTDVSKYFTVKDHVMLRHARSDGTQWQGKLSILPLYRSMYNMTIGINSYGNFRSRNSVFGNKSFILIGLVPPAYGSKEYEMHGYDFEGHTAVYNNCDTNNNNEIVLSVNGENTHAVKVCTQRNVVACTWIDNASPASYELQESYFYHYSMFMGGCGTYLNGISLSGSTTVTGAAVGLGFELD